MAILRFVCRGGKKEFDILPDDFPIKTDKNFWDGKGIEPRYFRLSELKILG